MNDDCYCVLFSFFDVKELRRLYLVNDRFKNLIIKHLIHRRFASLPNLPKSKISGHDVLVIGLSSKPNQKLLKVNTFSIWSRLHKSIQKEFQDIAYQHNKKIEIIDDPIYEIKEKLAVNETLSGCDYFNIAKYNTIAKSNEWDLLSYDLKVQYVRLAEKYNEKYILKDEKIYYLEKESNDIISGAEYYFLAKYGKIEYSYYKNWNSLKNNIKAEYRKLSDQHNSKLFVEEKLYRLPNDFVPTKVLTGYEVWTLAKNHHNTLPTEHKFNEWLKLKPEIRNYYYNYSYQLNSSLTIEII